MNTIGAAGIRERLAEILNEVTYGGKRYIIQRRGHPLAAIIPASEYQALIEMLSTTGISGDIHGIPVTVYFDGERYLIKDDRFELYGEGATLENARHDYWLAIRETMEDLEADADRLAPYLATRLKDLRKIVDAASQGEKAA